MAHMMSSQEEQLGRIIARQLDDAVPPDIAQTLAHSREKALESLRRPQHNSARWLAGLALALLANILVFYWYF